MQINRENYEAYFIDYLEGNLDENLVDDFIEFIKLNPDLKKELDLFESIEAVPETLAFDKKEKLYREKYDSETAFNTAAIAKIEGTISEKENSEFESYLAGHPDKKNEATLFAHTLLQADESIQFRHKNKLYRKSTGKTILLWAGRVAAVLILALAIFTFIDKRSDQLPLNNELAGLDKNIDKEEKTTNAIPDKETTPQKKVTPVEKKKTEVVNPQKVSPAPTEKKVSPRKKTGKSIRETGKGRIEEQATISAQRVPIELPPELTPITASLEVASPKAEMATMYISYPDEYHEELLLGEQVKEKINIRSLSKAGLELFANLSNERFSYKTNKEGVVTQYKYDSRLLAFSLPGRKAQPE